MKKMIIVFGIAAVLLLGLTYVYAQGPGFGKGPKGMPPHESWRPQEWSFLTPEQKVKFQELHRKFDEETAQLKGAMLTKKLELRSLWTNPKADPKAILDKEKELRDLQNQMKDKVIRNKLEARNLLTPEQIGNLGQGYGMGPGYGRGRMMGHGPGMGWGGRGPGYGCY
ncbi:MAG: Spy/CpxP family protein refolding chaperone [Syntrophaceae bacterium]|nr:Spy/CpxP family protein refolding chaperone [Syntrophaceae bacterium]